MKKMIILAGFIGLFSSCDKDDKDDTQSLNLNFSKLEDAGSRAQYEGWLIVNGSTVSTGTFTVNANGQPSKTNFEVNKTQLAQATAFVLTLEPIPDPAPGPSDVHILGGDFTNNKASLSVAHPAALNNNFSSASGKFILGTPTTSANTDELSGIWFMNLTGASPAAGLSLPTLPAGWKYEGWVLINGKPVTTGTFTNPAASDQAAPFSGPAPAPPFPGEDFIVNAPEGIGFPTNLSGGTAVISIEPVPDNSPAPFVLKPLLGNIPNPGVSLQTYNMGLNLSSFPTGTATR